MNLWIRLPKHLNIVKLVVDEMTICWVYNTICSWRHPGREQSSCIQIEWLQQLIDVVDELNLNLGIAHQGIASRNLVIDEVTDSLILFDINFSARIGQQGYSEARNDIKGILFTVYEMITRNDDLRAVRHEDQNVSILEQKDWVKHPDVQLDHPISEFRKLLNEWCEKRRAGKQITGHTDAPNFLDWPPLPNPPLPEVVSHYGGNTVKEHKM